MAKVKQNKLAVFDIDGTIFRKNLHFELLGELSYLGIFRKEVRNKLVGYYADWLAHQGTYERYRRALVKLYGENIKGCRWGDIREASRKVAEFNRDRTYIFAEELIKKFKKEKYWIIAISGSPIEIVEEYSKSFKFDEVFGSVYEIDKKGFYTGRAIFEPTQNKGQVLKQYVAEKGISLKGSHGVGDTESDYKFLELVEVPIAFNPDAKLKKIAERRKWKIVVEKKDVIYNID